MVDATGIEPASAGCKPAALPLSYAPINWSKGSVSRRRRAAAHAVRPAVVSLPTWALNSVLSILLVHNSQPHGLSYPSEMARWGRG